MPQWFLIDLAADHWHTQPWIVERDCTEEWWQRWLVILRRGPVTINAAEIATTTLRRDTGSVLLIPGEDYIDD